MIKTRVQQVAHPTLAAQKDFNSLQPTNVQKRNDGVITGKLADGRNVIVRNKSDDGRPTLEIQKGNNKTKIRYGSK